MPFCVKHSVFHDSNQIILPVSLTCINSGEKQLGGENDLLAILLNPNKHSLRLFDFSQKGISPVSSVRAIESNSHLLVSWKP